MARPGRDRDRQAARPHHPDRVPDRGRLPAARLDRLPRAAGLPGAPDGDAGRAAAQGSPAVTGAGHAVLADSITVGDHPTVHFLGMTFNVDTMYTTVIAAVLAGAFLYWVARKASSEVPNKTQVVVELVVNQTRAYVQDAVGHDVPAWLVPLGVCLFFFILFCNWLGWFPSGHHPARLEPPTADVNLV